MLPKVALAGAQPDVLPAASVARNWTSVSSSAETAIVAPVWGADHVVPPSREVRCS